MNRLQRWLSQDNPNTSRDYQPLDQSADVSSFEGNLERFSSHEDAQLSCGDSISHLDTTEIMPVHHFGIDLHPETAALMEDTDALALAFGGNSG
jgi:hypothetical protein